jgi:hypothetical protein
MDDLFPVALEKQADLDRTFGLLNYPLAAAALLTLMGAGGTAYITKRILDEKLREAGEKGLDIPKVKRIVFRSSPAAAASPEVEQIPQDMQKASEQDMTNIKAALFIMMDKLDSHTRVLGTPGIKQAQQQAGLPTSKLFNLSEGEIGQLMATLDANPALAKMIVRRGMATRPIMKHFQWLAGTTPGLAMGKRHIRDYLQKFLVKDRPAVPTTKVAQFANTAAAMMLGSTLGGSSADLAKTLLERTAQDPDVEQNAAGRPKIDLSRVEVKADDPAAAAYLKANKEKIIRLLQRLADEGKI